MVDKNFDDDLADDGSLDLWSIVLGGQAGFEDMIDDLTVVLEIECTI